MLGKLFSEEVEQIDAGPTEALILCWRDAVANCPVRRFASGTARFSVVYPLSLRNQSPLRHHPGRYWRRRHRDTAYFRAKLTKLGPRRHYFARDYRHDYLDRLDFGRDSKKLV